MGDTYEHKGTRLAKFERTQAGVFWRGWTIYRPMSGGYAATRIQIIQAPTERELRRMLAEEEG